MHPIKPELDGKDLSEFKDPNGFKLFVAFADTVRRQQAGFVAYQWPKPSSDKPVDKLSYVMGFEPWGWVIGSGIYVEQTAAAAAEMESQARSLAADASRFRVNDARAPATV